MHTSKEGNHTKKEQQEAFQQEESESEEMQAINRASRQKLPTTVGELQQLALGKKGRSSKQGVANSILQVARKHEHMLRSELGGVIQVGGTLGKLLDKKDITTLLICAVFLSWLGLQAQAGLATLGIAGMMCTYLFKKLPSIPEKHQLPWRAALCTWPRAVIIAIQEYTGSTGAIFAMLAASPPRPWEGDKMAYTTYKAMVVGYGIRVATKPATKQGKEDFTCMYCQKKIAIKSVKYAATEVQWLHTFFCGFANTNFGKTLAQILPDPYLPLSGQGLSKCSVCYAPVQDKANHEPMCAGRWREAPHAVTATFWRASCPTCGWVYLPGATDGVTPFAVIEQNKATPEEAAAWKENILGLHIRAHTVKTVTTPPRTGTQVMNFLWEFDADEALQSCPQQIMGTPKRANIAFEQITIQKSGSKDITLTIENSLIPLLHQAAAQPELYTMAIPGHYQKGVRVEGELLLKHPTQISPAVLALFCSEYAAYKAVEQKPLFEFGKATYTGRETSKKAPRAVKGSSTGGSSSTKGGSTKGKGKGTGKGKKTPEPESEESDSDEAETATGSSGSGSDKASSSEESESETEIEEDTEATVEA